MEVLNEIFNTINIFQTSGAVALVVLLYSVIHWAYDFFTKSDIEKCLTYRGKDRVLSGLLLFIVFVTIGILTTLDKLVNNEYEALFYFIMIFTISIMCFLIALFFGVIVQIIVILARLDPKFEIKIKSDKGEEYWEISKVTRDNMVILKKDNTFLTLSSANELNNIVIYRKYRRKK